MSEGEASQVESIIRSCYMDLKHMMAPKGVVLDYLYEKSVISPVDKRTLEAIQYEDDQAEALLTTLRGCGINGLQKLVTALESAPRQSQKVVGQTLRQELEKHGVSPPPKDTPKSPGLLAAEGMSFDDMELDALLSPASPPSTEWQSRDPILLHNIKTDCEREGCWFGGMSRESAEDVMKRHGKDGDFMVRESQSANFELTVMHQRRFCHLKMFVGDSGTILLGKRTFKSIARVIKRSKEVPICKVGGTRICLGEAFTLP